MPQILTNLTSLAGLKMVWSFVCDSWGEKSRLGCLCAPSTEVTQFSHSNSYPSSLHKPLHLDIRIIQYT